MVDDYSDAALVLVGHGSTKNADSSAPTYQHAAELRRRRLFAEVHEAFWKQPPGIDDALAKVSARRLIVAPLFLSEGYFVEQAIPEALGFGPEIPSGFPKIGNWRERPLYYCAAVGTHPSMTEVILARARDVITRYPFPRAPKSRDIALFLAGHGTERNENSRHAIDEHAAKIRELGVYREVQTVFIEEAPRIGECYELTQAKNIVMVPFFISDGLHANEDVPILLGDPERIVRERLAQGQPTWRNPTEKKGKLVWYTRSVGTEPRLADVSLQRVREALAAPACSRL